MEVRSLGWEDALEEDMATRSSILAWRIRMEKEAWWAPAHGVTQSWTRQSNYAQHMGSLTVTKVPYECEML